MIDLSQLQRDVAIGLPAHLGIRVVGAEVGALHAELSLNTSLMAVNGYLHAGAIVTLADTAAGLGCLAHLPSEAVSFTTIELKSNHVGTAREGTLSCEARLVHSGRMTQVWDATVSQVESGDVIAYYRATQMILYPNPRLP